MAVCGIEKAALHSVLLNKSVSVLEPRPLFSADLFRAESRLDLLLPLLPLFLKVAPALVLRLLNVLVMWGYRDDWGKHGGGGWNKNYIGGKTSKSASNFVS